VAVGPGHARGIRVKKGKNLLEKIVKRGQKVDRCAREGRLKPVEAKLPGGRRGEKTE